MRRFSDSGWRSLLARCLVAVFLLAIGTGRALTTVGAARASSGFDTHQGVDSCFVPTTSDLTNFWSVPAFYNYGWYLGGAEARDVGCAPWSSSLLSYAESQGWGFVPIWDDLQAPSGCGPLDKYGHRISFYDPMSLTPSVAQSQGQASGRAALSAMGSRGFSTIDEVWLDIEGYDTSQSACIQAVNAYVNGWDSIVTYDAGVYGSACGSDVNSWAGLEYVPQAVDWAWPGGAADSVWGAPCIASNERWVFDQRVHQYRNTDCTVTGDCVHKPYDVICADAWIDLGLFTGEPAEPQDETDETTSPSSEATCYLSAQP